MGRLQAMRVTKPDGMPFAREDAPSYRALAGETLHGLIEVLHFPDRELWLSVNAAPIYTPDG